ncbi:hypothetical protein [Prosthecomicrobium sp. N25]|uniref:hypothetical protein n=1 Tax=Prosthecomicrobium sp. N25 TaxID=3129254 RepID=UPI0030777DB0
MLKLPVLVLAAYAAGTPAVSRHLPAPLVEPLRAFHRDLTDGVSEGWSAAVERMVVAQRLRHVATAYDRAVR